MKKRRPSRRAKGSGDPTAKAADTRQRIFQAALSLFRKRGFDATTMRDVAREAGTSLGAAYYYFASKDAIVLAYYETVYAERQRRTRALLASTSDLRERIRGLYHVHFDAVQRDHKLIAALVRPVADPHSDLSVFSQQTREVRSGTIALFQEALSVDEVPEHLRDLGALALWTLDLALMLYFVWDRSPKQARTRKLIDDAVDALLPAIPLLASPLGAPMVQHLARTLLDAGLVVDD